MRVCLIPVKRAYVQLSSPGQTEELKGGWVGWVGGWRNECALRIGWVDNRFGYEKWLQGGSIGLALL